MTVNPLFAALAPWRGHWPDRHGLAKFRNQRLHQLIDHAYRNVPYYRQLFDRHGVSPSQVNGIADLQRIPITMKKDLHSVPPSAIVARGYDPNRLIVRRTSGSTGIPLEIRRTWMEERLLGRSRWQTLHAMGLRMGDRLAEIEELAPVHPRDHQLIHRTAQAFGLYRQKRINALAAPEQILRDLQRFKPHVVSGYAAAVAMLARTAARLELRALQLRFIVVHSDTLTRQMHASIEEGFGAPVYEIYDSNETNVIASQCPQTTGLHTRDDTTIVEVLVGDRPAVPGERGEIVLTTLHSYAMPFIRYRIGDLVIQGEAQCACGQPLGTIRAIQGRMFDYFPLPDGRVVHPYEIIAILDKSAPWIAEFQLTQERVDRVVLRSVAHDSPSPAQQNEIIQSVVNFLGDQVSFDLELVASIQREPSAKLRVCRSLVASDYDAPD